MEIFGTKAFFFLSFGEDGDPVLIGIESQSLKGLT